MKFGEQEGRRIWLQSELCNISHTKVFGVKIFSWGLCGCPCPRAFLALEALSKMPLEVTKTVQQGRELAAKAQQSKFDPGIDIKLEAETWVCQVVLWPPPTHTRTYHTHTCVPYTFKHTIRNKIEITAGVSLNSVNGEGMLHIFNFEPRCLRKPQSILLVNINSRKSD